MTNDSTKSRNENRYLNIIGRCCSIEDTVTGEIIKGSAIGDLLNELNNENQQLKQQLQQQEMEYATYLHQKEDQE